ncbi:MAG: hypothetical protein NVSMB19_19640 [Vulcanimicrobiaceae bacterium]
MQRHELLSTLERAETDVADAIEVRDGLQLWASRLLPYLQRDPHMTVAEALRHYDEAQRT